MGRMNEDVFNCKQCGRAVVYEPANEHEVTCSHCGSTYTIENTRKITLVDPQLMPVGITPKNIWILKRIDALREAIYRYMIAAKTVPREWYEEMEEHVRGLETWPTKEKETTSSNDVSAKPTKH